MGGRGSSSATSRSLPIGASGIVSTDGGDYAGMSQGRIQDELSMLPYEVAALFNSRGQLVGILTDGKEGQVVAAPSFLGAYRYATNHPEDGGPLTHFHNHPIEEGTQGIFSSDDIGIYANSAISYAAGVKGSPVKNVVKTSDGRTYSLEYVGGGRKKLSGFKRAYAYEEKKAAYRASDQVNGTGSRTSAVDDHLARWLGSNARDYGFDFSYSGPSRRRR